MWVWWMIGAAAVLSGAAVVRDRRRHSAFRRELPADLSKARRREALRLHRAELSAYRRKAAGDGGGFGFDGGGGHFGGFDGGGFDGGGCGGGDGGAC
jgi:uncharacterized membrane protein YgcG